MKTTQKRHKSNKQSGQKVVSQFITSRTNHRHYTWELCEYDDDRIDGSRMQIAQQITFFYLFCSSVCLWVFSSEEDDVDGNCWEIACLTLKNELYFIIWNIYIGCFVKIVLLCVPTIALNHYIFSAFEFT